MGCKFCINAHSLHVEITPENRKEPRYLVVTPRNREEPIFKVMYVLRKKYLCDASSYGQHTNLYEFC